MPFRGLNLAAGILAGVMVAAAPLRAADAPALPPTPAPLAKEAVDYFEARVRPVLIDRCYTCHDGAGTKPVKGGLSLSTREGVLRGGESGKPAIVPGDPAASPLIKAVKWTDEQLKMPPRAEHRLTAEQVADLEAWVRMGAPETGAPTRART